MVLANLKAHGVSFELAKTVSKIRLPSSALMTVKTMARSVLSSPAWQRVMFCCLSPTQNARSALALFPLGEQRNMSKTTTSGKTPKPPRPMTAEAIERARVRIATPSRSREPTSSG